MATKMTKSNVPAISAAIAVHHQTVLAGRALARLEAAAKAVHETSSKDRELQLISTNTGGFSAIIRHGKTLVEISGDDFAVRQVDR